MVPWFSLFGKDYYSMEDIKSIVGVDHIGYAVKDIMHSRDVFIALGYVFDEVKADEYRQVNVSLGENGGVRIELLAALDKEKKSPIDGYINKVGSTPYHICYEVNDIQDAITELQNIGFTMLGNPTESIPLGGIVCFLYSSEIGLIELISYMEVRTKSKTLE